MALLRVLKHLEREGITYQLISHPPAFSAQKIAAAAHIPGREMAKTVMAKLDHQLVMAILPADRTLNLEHLRLATGADIAMLATELEFNDRFPDCEGGAMPPFGNLYGLPVFMSGELTRLEYFAFNAGNHREIIRVQTRDFIRLVQPRILDLSLLRV
jgi:Ala-tRNA(Pro) deacylase